MKKGGQLHLLALLNSVLCLTWTKAEQRKFSWPSVAKIKPLWIRFLHHRPIISSQPRLLLQRVTRWCQLPWLHRWIDHVLLNENRTLQEYSAANHYVSQRKSGRNIQLGVGIVLQSITQEKCALTTSAVSLLSHWRITVCPLSVNNKRDKYSLLLDSSY